MVSDRIGQTNTNGTQELAVEKSLGAFSSLLLYFFLPFFLLPSSTLVCYLRRYGILNDSLPPFFVFLFPFVGLLFNSYSFYFPPTLICIIPLPAQRETGRFFFFFLVSNFCMEIYQLHSKGELHARAYLRRHVHVGGVH